MAARFAADEINQPVNWIHSSPSRLAETSQKTRTHWPPVLTQSQNQPVADHVSTFRTGRYWSDLPIPPDLLSRSTFPGEDVAFSSASSTKNNVHRLPNVPLINTKTHRPTSFKTLQDSDIEGDDGARDRRCQTDFFKKNDNVNRFRRRGMTTAFL